MIGKPALAGLVPRTLSSRPRGGKGDRELRVQRGTRIIKVLVAGLVLGAASTATQPARADTFVEQSAEFRMQLDFVVPDAALRKFLPAGWEPNIATQGPAKDCNLRMIFIDRVDITGADGAPIGSSRLVHLAAPVKQRGRSTAGPLPTARLPSQ